MDTSLRKFLFEGWKGCSNHGCIVTGPKKGMGTNSICTCVQDANRTQLMMLQGRLTFLIAQDEADREPTLDQECRRCLSVTGLEEFIAKHHPDYVLRPKSKPEGEE